MSTLRDHIESLRTRVNAIAAEESELVSSLGDALAEADAVLISEVRRISAMHEQRRFALVAELSALAVRVGFLPSVQPVGSVADEYSTRAFPPPPVEERFAPQPSTSPLSHRLSDIMQ